MGLILLGKPLEDWEDCYISIHELRDIFSLHNLQVMRWRIEQDELESAAMSFIGSNKAACSMTIITGVKYVYSLNFFNDEEWLKITPLIEEALRFNMDYLVLLDKIAPDLKEFCDKYKKGHYTLMERFKLEFWQGRFLFKDKDNPTACYR